MSSFVEERLADEEITTGTAGGPTFSTHVVQTDNSSEQRTAVWSRPLGRYDFGSRSLLDNQLEDLLNFFINRQGRLIGFRLKDFGDYKVAATQGVLRATATIGSFQLAKRYATDTAYYDRNILKPVVGSVVGIVEVDMEEGGIGVGALFHRQFQILTAL